MRRAFSLVAGRACLGLCAAFTLIALAACAAPPVQEMSNARQAVHAAQAAGAPQYAPRIYAEAVHWLDDAEYALKRRDYSRARSSAVHAEQAARAATLAAHKAHPPPAASASPPPAAPER